MIAPMLLSADEGADFIGVSERLYHQLRREPNFPRAVLLSRRCLRWKREELAAYVEKLPTVGAQPEPLQLRRSRAAVEGK